MPFLRIAHRGASGTRPEHTRAAFQRALEIGVDMIELDVQLTRDAQLVVLHDPELGRTVTGPGIVREQTLSELCAMDSGSWFDSGYAGASVLSLNEVLDITAGKASLNVEIKSPEPDWATTADVLLDLLHGRGELENTVISCFDVGALRCVRAKSHAARIGMLWHEVDLTPMWEYAREVQAENVHPYWALADPALVSTARSYGFGVLAWTVNEVEIMRQLIDNGVTGIISDFPERFAQI